MNNVLVELIAKHGEKFIIFAGVVVFVLMMINGVILSNCKSRIKENLKLDSSIYALNLKDEKVEELEDQKIVIAPNTIRSFENKFNEACSYHDILTQFIPIFPLLGILGTVAGLMLMVPGNENVTTEVFEKLYGGMGTALDTTFYGLIAAITLKFVDAVFATRIINDVDVMIDDFNKKLELAGMFKKF